MLGTSQGKLLPHPGERRVEARCERVFKSFQELQTALSVLCSWGGESRGNLARNSGKKCTFALGGHTELLG